ncbi:hypothetical protein [Streptomyces sp. NBC_01614]|uniref:Uncharacterized protein n=1 Tax=Streptomyces sp. NBC_00180 TaxID=2903632 RepID=A0AAU1HWF6_9ACTN
MDEFGADDLPFETGFGNGQLLTREELETINTTYAEATVRQASQPGDVMFVAMGNPIHLEDHQPTVAASAEIEDVA